MNEFAPYAKLNTSFIVRNVTLDRKKTIRIFQYPILYNTTRDLLAIPGIGEGEIRASLLKGELLHKILAKDIIIEFSDIDLLQFNDEQKKFLQQAGLSFGTTVSAANLTVIKMEDVSLIGICNSINTIFKTAQIFIQNSTNKIIVFKNGIKQVYLDDFLIAESGGVGTGYDSVIFTVAPETSSVITADYYVGN